MSKLDEDGKDFSKSGKATGIASDSFKAGNLNLLKVAEEESEWMNDSNGEQYRVVKLSALKSYCEDK